MYVIESIRYKITTCECTCSAIAYSHPVVGRDESKLKMQALPTQGSSEKLFWHYNNPSRYPPWLESRTLNSEVTF